MSLSKEAREKLSKRNEGNQYRKGIPFSKEAKQKLSEKRKKRVGNKAPGWKGGLTPIRILIGSSNKYKEWRQQVFIRDNFTCQECRDNTGDNLEAHHKKSFTKLFEEAKNYMPLLKPYDAAMVYSPLWDVNNGKTLCEKCHRKIKK